jgi:beta-lactam-binding protein with PASTA domain
MLGMSMVIASLALVTACSAEPEPRVTVTVSATATVTAGPLDELGDQIEGAVDDATAFTMPDVVGMSLQDAQDKLQELGSYLMDQEDATDKGRLQIIDDNWVVCRQEPVAGTQYSKLDVVTLWSVKNGEDCPAKR